MSVEIEYSGPGSAADAVVDTLNENKKQLTVPLIMEWFEFSQDRIYDIDRERGPQSDLSHIADAAERPYWWDDKWIIHWEHRGAVFQEYGAAQAEIEAKKAEVLAFEWPDAPREVQEQFEHTEGDLVFFQSVERPALPALRFARDGREAAKRKAKEMNSE